MKALAADLHQHGYIVSQDVPVDDDNYDMKSLGQVNDYLVPMVYDEHYENGEPGPVASEAFFEGQLDKIAKVVEPSKVVVGFGNYGYDWTIGGQGSDEVTFDQIMATGERAHASVQWDAATETLSCVTRPTAGSMSYGFSMPSPRSIR